MAKYKCTKNFTVAPYTEEEFMFRETEEYELASNMNGGNHGYLRKFKECRFWVPEEAINEHFEKIED